MYIDVCDKYEDADGRRDIEGMNLAQFHKNMAGIIFMDFWFDVGFLGSFMPCFKRLWRGRIFIAKAFLLRSNLRYISPRFLLNAIKWPQVLVTLFYSWQYLHGKHSNTMDNSDCLMYI